MTRFFIKVIFPTVRGTFQFITICSVKEKERNRDCHGSTYSWLTVFFTAGLTQRNTFTRLNAPIWQFSPIHRWQFRDTAVIV